MSEVGERYEGIVLLGEAPGPEEDGVGRPFVGPAGRYLGELLASNSLDIERFALVNVVKCWPHVSVGQTTRTVPPKTDALRTCSEKWLRQEFKRLKPHTVVALGATALKFLMPEEGISQVHRRVLKAQVFGSELRIIPLYHPAAKFHAPKLEEEIRLDYAALPKLLRQTPEEFITETGEYSFNDFSDFFHHLEDSDHVAIDTETFEEGLPMPHARLLGISVSGFDGLAAYMESSHPKFAQILENVRHQLNSPSAQKYLWNAAFDLRVLDCPDAQNYHDGMLMAYVLEKPLLALKECVESELRIRTPTLDQLKKQFGVKAIQDVPIEARAKYAAHDALYTRRLTMRFMEQLKTRKLWGVYERFERPVVPVVMEMVRHGMSVSGERLQQIGQQLEPLAQQALAGIQRQAGNATLNPRSNQKLAETLFHKLKLPVIKLTDAGAESVDKDVLAALATKHPIITLILKYRELSGLLSKYVHGLPKHICSVCGRVHTNLKQFGAESGRFSSSDPNLQNIPVRTALGRQIREAFVAQPGNVLLAADYSQVELRTLSLIAPSPELILAFQHGEDVHMRTAVRRYELPVDQITKPMRDFAKRTNFGIPYGLAGRGLYQQIQFEALNEDLEESVRRFLQRTSVSECESAVEDWHKEYSGVREYQDRQRTFVLLHGYIVGYFGRITHIPEALSSDRKAREHGVKAAFAIPIQGMAADVMKLALVAVQKGLTTANLSAKMILQVHDELIVECPKGEVEAVRSVLQATMPNVVKLQIPFPITVKVGPNWGEMKEI